MNELKKNLLSVSINIGEISISRFTALAPSATRGNSKFETLLVKVFKSKTKNKSNTPSYCSSDCNF